MTGETVDLGDYGDAVGDRPASGAVEEGPETATPRWRATRSVALFGPHPR
jgi:hypothetical protein